MIWFVVLSMIANLFLALGVVSIGSSYLEQREFTGYLQSQNDLLSEQLTEVMTAALAYMEGEEEGYEDGGFAPIEHVN